MQVDFIPHNAVFFNVSDPDLDTECREFAIYAKDFADNQTGLEYEVAPNQTNKPIKPKLFTTSLAVYCGGTTGHLCGGRGAAGGVQRRDGDQSRLVTPHDPLRSGEPSSLPARGRPSC